MTKGEPFKSNRSWSSFGDTDDHAAVSFGVALFDNYGEDISESKFTSLISSYSSAMSRVASPAPATAQRDGILEYNNNFFNGPFAPPANDS